MSFGALRIRWFAPCMVLVAWFVASPSSAGLATEITRATLEILQEEGHALEDILAAERLRVLYDADFAEILEARQRGTPWFAIVHSLDQEGARYHRLGADEMAAVLSRGYGVNNLIVGNLTAQRFRYSLDIMMILKQEESMWMGLFDGLYAREQQVVRTSLDSKIINLGSEKLSRDVRAGLSDSQIEHHLARGLNGYDFERAVEMGQQYNVDVELAVAVKSPNLGWADAERLLSRLIAQE